MTTWGQTKYLQPPELQFNRPVPGRARVPLAAARGAPDCAAWELLLRAPRGPFYSTQQFPTTVTGSKNQGRE